MTAKLDFAEVQDLQARTQEIIKQGAPRDNAIDFLISNGLDPSYADLIVSNAESDLFDKKSFRRLLFGGIFIVLCGLAINYYSYRIAQNFGVLFYYVFWGIVVVGLVMILRAFIIFRK